MRRCVAVVLFVVVVTCVVTRRTPLCGVQLGVSLSLVTVRVWLTAVPVLLVVLMESCRLVRPVRRIVKFGRLRGSMALWISRVCLSSGRVLVGWLVLCSSRLRPPSATDRSTVALGRLVLSSVTVRWQSVLELVTWFSLLLVQVWPARCMVSLCVGIFLDCVSVVLVRVSVV